MLNLDINHLLELREIENPRKFLVKNGFTYSAAGRLLKNEIAGTRNIEKLCLVLNCTPDDLFNWTSDKGMKNSKNVALSKLAGRKSIGRIVPKLKGLSENKLEELHQFIDKLSAAE